MINIPPLSLMVAMHMRRKFPERCNNELLLLWDAAFNWIGKHVFAAHLEPEPPPLLVAAAFLYVQSVLESDPHKKAAYLHDAHELIAVYS